MSHEKGTSSSNRETIPGRPGLSGEGKGEYGTKPMTNQLICVATAPISHGGKKTWCQQPGQDFQCQEFIESQLGEILGSNLFLLIWIFKNQDLEKLKWLIKVITAASTYQRQDSNTVVLPKSVSRGKGFTKKLIIVLIVGRQLKKMGKSHWNEQGVKNFPPKRVSTHVIKNQHRNHVTPPILHSGSHVTTMVLLGWVTKKMFILSRPQFLHPYNNTH